MSELKPVSSGKTSADWLLRGVLTKLGDIFDRFTGRRWIPSSSLAASELSESMKQLLNAEAKNVAGKGVVVPHNIKLKIQWDKFSTDSESSLKALETELLTAAVDHINDSLYYTYAPLSLEVKPDYFTEGVKLLVSFEKFNDDTTEAEVNVSVPSVNLGTLVTAHPENPAAQSPEFEIVAKFLLSGTSKEIKLNCSAGGRISVGRTGENGLMIDETSVSKYHAAVVVTEAGELSVADTGSTNGTFVNGERIGYGKAVIIGTGDKVRFGTVDVMFELVSQPLEVKSESTELPSADEKIEIDGFQFTSRVTPSEPDVQGASMLEITEESEDEEDK